jgi:hypothetical protein
MFRRLVLVVLALTCAAAAPALAQTAESEPNDYVRQAGGPLAGGADHVGRLTGSGDVDWFLFYVNAGDFDVLVTNTSTEGGCTSLRVSILDTDAKTVASFGLELGDDPKRVPLTASGHERFYVRIDSESGCRPGAGRSPASYVVRVDPAGVVTSQAPPGLRPPACQDARDRLTIAQRALRRARGARRKRAARRQVARARRAVARAC